jgi:hypothetical protein
MKGTKKLLVAVTVNFIHLFFKTTAYEITLFSSPYFF